MALLWLLLPKAINFFNTVCVLCAWAERMNKLILGRSWENNLNLSREQTLGRRCYPVVLNVVMQRSVKTEWRTWKSTEEKCFFRRKKVRKTNTVLTKAFESLFDNGLFETQRQKQMTDVIKNVRKHFGPSPVSNSKKRSKTWKCDFSAYRISRCESPSKILSTEVQFLLFFFLLFYFNVALTLVCP